MPKSLSCVFLSLVFAMAVSACGKKAADTAEAPPAATTAPAPMPAPPEVAKNEPTPQELELAEKKALLEYATMEDQFLNDPRGQWAASAKASSSFGVDKPDPEVVARTTGKVDGNVWTNNNQSLGFDWLELGYAKPVSATEVRVVVHHGDGVEAINKVELIDTTGAAHTVWTGISEVKPESRGERTWFVRKFDATPYKVKGVKISIANSMQNGYKEIDAVQLIGD